MMQTEDNTVWRRTMRREMLARRAALSAEVHAAWSAQIAAHLLKQFPPPPVVAFCWPVRQEPDVRAALLEWHGRGVQLSLPVVLGESEPLRFRTWSPHSDMAPDRYGIPTPVAGEWVLPELILIPLNGFDAAGFRLGYGGGFFDRTLAALSPRPQTIGLGFEMNRLDSIRPEVHDQRLDWIVTEAGVFPAADG